MAHKIETEIPTRGRVRKFLFPNISGRFGFSLYFGSKELFIGIVFSDVVLETITRKRMAKISQGKARMFGFDPLA